MDDVDDPLVVQVRADAGAFRGEMLELKRSLSTELGEGADVAGRGIASALSRAARTGKLEFEDLARAAARSLGEIAGLALRGGSGTQEGVAVGGVLQGGLTALLGLPGRATGGPVAPGRAYVVGERGPELFVPTSSGRVEASPGRGSTTHVTVNVRMPAGARPEFMGRTGRQIAHDVARALERVQR